MNMTGKVLAKAQVGEAVLTWEVTKVETNETARQEGKGLEASQHAGAIQRGKPEKHQMQQQPKPNPKLRLKQQSNQQHEPKPEPRSTPARRCD